MWHFQAQDSSGRMFRIEVRAAYFDEAREKAMNLCYRMGLCFLGRI